MIFIPAHIQMITAHRQRLEALDPGALADCYRLTLGIAPHGTDPPQAPINTILAAIYGGVVMRLFHAAGGEA